ncbi:Transcriptional regulator, GntR family [Agrococcus casei LMG 22410]|uniref:Transcriptional regulator, GntR family n=2 Tax=Agrococcus TaxID=46352 RepID=A0A1R4FTD6_9MICO|nr:Transcriptional regulator, GntR family [Agrococcus casei LMG 22410]
MARASHGSVLDDLGVRIASGEVAAGSVLTLAQLEEHYEVSRTVIREAVRVLEAKQMLVSRRRVGVTVQQPELWSNLDAQLIRWRLDGPQADQQIVALTELRLAIEPTAARLMARHADPLERAQLLQLAEQLQRLGDAGQGDSDEYLDADIEFHNLILTASRNPLFSSIKETVAEMLTGRHSHGQTPANPFEDALANHVAAARMIADGDEDAAEAATRRYVEAVLSEVAVD